MNIDDIASNSELLYSWGRYLYWAELKYRDFDKYMTEKGDDAGESKAEWLGVYSYWAASLYVVVEGWEVAHFTDPIVDALLGVSNYKDTLRRLRNGTFHYQSELIPEKFVSFFRSPDVTLWLHVLHEEMCRWLRDCVEIVERAGEFAPDQTQDWRDTFAKLIGWLPLRPAEEEQRAARKKYDEIEAMLDASGSQSDAARELRAALGGYDVLARETAARVREYRRNNLARLGLNPDTYVP